MNMYPTWSCLKWIFPDRDRTLYLHMDDVCNQDPVDTDDDSRLEANPSHWVWVTVRVTRRTVPSSHSRRSLEAWSSNKPWSLAHNHRIWEYAGVWASPQHNLSNLDHTSAPHHIIPVIRTWKWIAANNGIFNVIWKQTDCSFTYPKLEHVLSRTTYYLQYIFNILPASESNLIANPARIWVQQPDYA